MSRKEEAQGVGDTNQLAIIEMESDDTAATGIDGEQPRVIRAQCQ